MAWYVEAPTNLQNGTIMSLHNLDIWLRDVLLLNKWVPGSHIWTYIILFYYHYLILPQQFIADER